MDAQRPRGGSMSAITEQAAELSGSTMADTLMGVMGEHGGTAVRHKDGETWATVSHGELRATAREIARGLMALGVARGDRVAILSNTRPEWTYADIGAMCAGTVVAPVYQTNSPEECEYV